MKKLIRLLKAQLLTMITVTTKMKSSNNRYGFTLVDSIVAMIIIVLTVLAAIFADFLLTSSINDAQDKYTAITLIGSQVEDLKAIARHSYSHEALDEDVLHNTTLSSIPDGFSISYLMSNDSWPEDGDDDDTDYKTVTVLCTYGDENQRRVTAYIIEN